MKDPAESPGARHPFDAADIEIAGGPPRVKDAAESPGARHPLDAAAIAIAPSALMAYPTATEEVREIVADAASRGAPLRIVAAGTWMDAGRPVHPAAVPVSLASLRGIVDYTPGDLTLTARAGTSLEEIARATEAHGQWLALDPFGDARGTIGATLATASAGPLAGALGLARDVALGIEMVTGDGLIVRGGGRVVKNVAGFDLTRLAVGAWGTIGVLTEVSVRLRARPECDETLAIRLDSPADLAPLVERLRAAPIAPIAIEAIVTGAAGASAIPVASGSAVLLVRLAGNEPSVIAERRALTALADVHAVDQSVWNALRAIEPRDASVVRFSALPSRLRETWDAARSVAAAIDGGCVHASVERGVARCILPTRDAALVRTALARADGAKLRRTFERLPAALWPELAPSAIDDRLSRGIALAFDPRRILNPGILGPAAS